MRIILNIMGLLPILLMVGCATSQQRTGSDNAVLGGLIGASAVASVIAMQPRPQPVIYAYPRHSTCMQMGSFYNCNYY